MKPLVLFLVAALAAGPLSSAAGAAERVAFFGVLLLNESMEPTTEAEEARRRAVEATIVEMLSESGRYEFVDIAPVAEKADLYGNLAQCNGCDVRLAKELGADIALTGEVQKTSNLILHMTLYLRDAETGNLVGGGSADIRGNNDASWDRGIRYVIRNRILTE